MLLVCQKLLQYIKKEVVLMAALGAAVLSALYNPPSAAYWKFIDLRVLLCLFCLMMVVAGFKKMGAFEAAATFVAQKSRNMRSLTLGILLLTYFMAMIMTNDVALITLVPFTLILLDKIGENEYAILIIVLQTIGANIGSSLTPVGNPQNLFLFSFYQVPLGEFFLILLPVVAAGGLLLCLSTLLIEKRVVKIPESMDQTDWGDDKSRHGKSSIKSKMQRVIFSILFLISLLAIFDVIPIQWVTGFLIIVILFFDRHLLREVDYSLLLTFVGFFIFVGNMSAIPQVNTFLSGLLTEGVYGLSLLTSQVISNVPAAVLLSGFTSDYRSLLLGVNVGGMGTLIASLASVISYKLYTRVHTRGTRRYLGIFTGLNLVFLSVLSIVALVL